MHHLLLKPKVLVIMRHAESQQNIIKKGFFLTPEEKDQLGTLLNHHVELTEKGISQAHAAGKKLAHQYGNFDIVINSGYQRTRETMRYVLEEFSVQPSIILQDFAIRERDTGYTSHMTEEEAHDHFPWNKKVWGLNEPFFTRPMGGESMLDVVKRLDIFFLKLAQICAGKKVLLVTHGRTISCIRSLLENWSIEQLELMPKNVENAYFLQYKLQGETLVPIPEES